jgi:hypothetical protein
MSQGPGFDPHIPVLTEVVPGQAAPGAQTPAPGEPGADALELPVRQERVASQLESLAIDSWTAPEWKLLERRLSERIVGQLQGRFDAAIEQQLQDAMGAIVLRAVAGLADELKTGLQPIIEQMVTRAVAQELAQLQSLKKTA